MENTKKSVVDFIVKSIRRLAFIFILVALGYLANNGELGANTVTAISTISPLALVIVTYLYEVMRWILPKAIVTLIWSTVTKYVGKENVPYLKTLIDATTPQALMEQVSEFLNDIKLMKNDIVLIKEKQDNVL